MLKLHGTSHRKWDGEPFVARLTTRPERPLPLRQQEVLLVKDCPESLPGGYRAYLCFDDMAPRDGGPVLQVPPEMGYLTDGDIVHVSPRAGQVSVLYRQGSTSNTMFLTERCNCHCIMCPQCPRDSDDEYWLRMWLDAIPLMSAGTLELGISGGEPTLVPDGLLRLIQACRNHLPQTYLQVLTNGRMFSYLSYCQQVASIKHPDLLFGIPLYSDLACLHNYIVQADGAFDQTVRGIMNLRRYGQRVELRVVLMRPNIKRLADLAYFIARNLPFVEHVALMGLEPMGQAATNWNDLWVDPLDYQPSLLAAVDELTAHRLAVSIYNHQLCVLERRLWPFARKSISDWKTEYFDQCDCCSVRGECGGLFASARRKHSRGIHPPEQRSCHPGDLTHSDR